LLEGLADAPLKSRLKAAMAKLEAVLSPQAVGRVADLNDRVAVASPLLKTGPLATLLEATNERRVVDLTYHGIARGEITRRDIEPLGLVRYANVWLVPAYCRLRDDLRVFRADRVLDAKLTGTSFAPRSGLSLKDYLHRCEIEAARFPSGS
jgi:predicted DNA-binding transcriptional regulator YafY